MKYKGYTIYLDLEEGYHWDNGGYCETPDECRDDIDWYIAQWHDAYPDLYAQEDTPCLPEPWWHTR